MVHCLLTRWVDMDIIIVLLGFHHKLDHLGEFTDMVMASSPPSQAWARGRLSILIVSLP